MHTPTSSRHRSLSILICMLAACGPISPDDLPDFLTSEVSTSEVVSTSEMSPTTGSECADICGWLHMTKSECVDTCTGKNIPCPDIVCHVQDDPKNPEWFCCLTSAGVTTACPPPMDFCLPIP
jgi:hypothetical protein